MVKQFFHKKSKRVNTRTRCKIEKKVREHNRQLKKAKNKNAASKRKKKDPGVPNTLPFKEEVLQEAEQRQKRLVEQREKQKLIRKANRQKVMNKKRNLDSLMKDVKKRTADFNRKDEFIKETVSKEYISGGKNMESSLKAYYKEFRKVVEASDVVLEVLDARDPLGSRCPQVEEAVLSAGASKRLILVLNKVDLVPRENVEQWLKYLRNEFPTVAFKASTQTQTDKLSQSKVPLSLASEDLRKTSRCLGAEMLLTLLGNYCRNKDIRTAIQVGVVGFPNVGKSSIINSLKRSKACCVGATPGVTKQMQTVQLDKHVKLLDSPGIVMATSKSDPSTVLKNCVKVESLDDPVSPVEYILKRCSKQQMMMQYCVTDFSDVHEFLALLATRQGRLKKGGLPDSHRAAKVVLQDWNTGKITYYTHPPEAQSMPEHLSAEIVTEMAKEFNIDALLGEEQSTLKELRSKSMKDIVMETDGPTQGVLSEDQEVEEEDDEDEEMDEEETNGDEENEEEEDDDEFEDMEEEEVENPTKKMTVSAKKSKAVNKRAADAVVKRTADSKRTKSKPAATKKSLPDDNLQMNKDRKQLYKKLKKKQKKSEKVALELSDAMEGAFGGADADEDYDFSTAFK